MCIMKISNQGKHTVSLFRSSRFVCEKIKKEIESGDIQGLFGDISNIVITDITAGNGGDVITFSRYFKFVNAIEKCPYEFKHLKNNVISMERDNIKLFNADCTKIINFNKIPDINDLQQDVVYIDPPWGGVNYKKYASLRLFINDSPIEKIVYLILNNNIAKLVAIKAPYNFAIELFTSIIKKEVKNVVITIEDIGKYYLVLCYVMK